MNPPGAPPDQELRGRRSTARAWAGALASLALLAGCAGSTPSGPAESLLREGKEHFGARRFDDAISSLQEVVKRDPRSSAAYIYLARAYGAKRAWPEAIAAGRTAFELAPDSTEASIALTGSLYRGGLDALARKRHAEAVGRLDEYVRLRPGHVQGYVALGNAHLAAGAWAAALDAYRQGLARTADGPERDEIIDALLDGGSRALDAQAPAPAAGFLEAYVGIDRFNTYAYLLLGRAYREAGERAKALEAFRRVLELNPRDVEALRSVRAIGG
jgi:cytochrome c-type biogenesis protein CcmH/NrfG